MELYKRRNLRNLLLVLFGIAVFVGLSPLNTSDIELEDAVEPSVPQAPPAYRSLGLSVQGISLGMSRLEVERLLGPGDSYGHNSVAYGRKWLETNPFDVERRELRIEYDDDEFVSEVTGTELQRKGALIAPIGSDFQLDDFGPSKTVGVAAREGEGDYDYAVMLTYPEAGLLIEYYNENRMWVTLVAPFER